MASDPPQEQLRRVVAALRTSVQAELEAGVDEIPMRAAAERRARAATVKSKEPAASPSPPPVAPEKARPAAVEKAPAPLALAQIREDIGDCRRCKLCSGRTQIVFGVGNPDADVMFVGEGPGEEEDRRGEPFVGRAGQLLTDIITKGMGLRREDVYIANVVKCRPPGNRNPEPDEIEACSPFLRRQIAMIRPKVIVALGKFAAQTLAGVDTPITRMRGRWHEFAGTKLMPTFHPSYLLRNPSAKREVWEDIQAVMREIGLPAPASARDRS